MALRLSGLFSTNVSDMQRGESAALTRNDADASREHQKELASKALTPGQTIRGEIVEKDGQEVQIRVGRDLILHARMEQDIPASRGQNVTFEVRSNASGVMALRPLFQNLSQENNALKALVQAGLDSDARSLQMVSAMMKEGMSVGKEALREMNQLLMGIPDAEIENAVQLSRLRIPASPENLEQFAAYKNYEHQLLSAFSETAEEIPAAVSQLFAERKAGAGIQLVKDLLMIFDGEEAFLEAPAQQLSENGTVLSFENTVQRPDDQKGELQDVVLSDQQAEAEINTEDSTKIAITDEAGRENTHGIQPSEEKEGIFRKEELAEGKEAGERAVIQQETQKETGEKIDRMSGEKAVLSAADRQHLSALIKEAGAGEKNAVLLQNGQMEEKELYQLVRRLAEEADTPERKSAVKELFVSKEFQKLLKEKIGSQWMLKAPQQMEKEAVSKLYERLNEQTRQLTQALSQAVKSNSPLFKSVQNMRENVDFLNQLNQMYTYVQLPLKFDSGQANGDLYVYTNKKNLARKDGNISAFLHLDMEHLGMVDVYVAMEQGRITTNFYVEDEESLRLLEKNIDILTAHLNEKGYQAACSVAQMEQAGSAIKELMASDKNIGIISEKSFDVRA